MSRIIYKFPLDIIDRQDISLFHRAVIMSVRMQNGTPVLYALVDPKGPVQWVTIRCIGTGNEFHDDEQMLTLINSTEHEGLREIHHWFLELPI